MKYREIKGAYDKFVIRMNILHFARVFIPLSILVYCCIVVLHSYIIFLKTGEIIKTEKDYLSIQKLYIENKAPVLNNEILFLASLNSANNYTDGKNMPQFAINTYKSFAEKNANYHKLFFIDKEGYEKIKIVETKGTISAENNLELKKDVFYFKRGITLIDGETYITPLDVEIENGTVKKPYKPVIRLVAPAFVNGSITGVVVGHFDFSKIMSSLQHSSTKMNGRLIFINESGFYYTSSDKQSEWNFLFETNVSNKFAKDYPSVWANMPGNSGFVKHKNQYFVYQKVNFLEKVKMTNDNPKEFKWVMISHINKKTFSEMTFTINKGFYILYTFSFFCLLFVSFYINKLIEINHDYKLKVMTKYNLCPLTGSINRNEARNIIATEMARIKKNNRKLFYSYISINNFKKINSDYGIDNGDNILVESSSIIKKCLHSKDYLIRWESSGFLILFPDSSIDKAIKLSGHINIELNNYFHNNHLKLDFINIVVQTDEIISDKEFFQKITQ